MDATSESKVEVKPTEDVAAEAPTEAVAEAKPTDVPAKDEEKDAAPTTQEEKAATPVVDTTEEKPVAQTVPTETVSAADLPPPPPNPVAETIPEPVKVESTEAASQAQQPEPAKTESPVEAPTATPSPAEEPVKTEAAESAKSEETPAPVPEPAKVEETPAVPEPVAETTPIAPVESAPTEIPPPVPTTDVPIVEPVQVSETVQPPEPVKEVVVTPEVAPVTEAPVAPPTPVEENPITEAPVAPPTPVEEVVAQVEEAKPVSETTTPVETIAEEQTNTAANGVSSPCETEAAKSVDSTEIPVVKEEAAVVVVESAPTPAESPVDTHQNGSTEVAVETTQENQKESAPEIISPEPEIKTIPVEPINGETVLNGDNKPKTNGELKESPIKSEKQVGSLPALLNWTHGGKEISVSGSFNMWKSPVTLTEENGTHALKLNLAEGEYHYKFLVDGKWITSNDVPTAEIEEHGQVNILVVKGSGSTEE